LKLFLLKRKENDTDNLLYVNFDDNLICLLREIR